MLDPLPPVLQRRGAARRRGLDLENVTGIPDLAGEIARRGTVRGHDLVRAGIATTPIVVPEGAASAGEWIIDGAVWDRWRDRLPAVVDDWADAHPLQPGIPPAKAALMIALPDPAIIDDLVSTLPTLTIDSSGLRRRDRSVQLPLEVDRGLAELLDRLAVDPFDAPMLPELASAGLTEKHLAVAVNDGRLVRVGAAIYLRPDALDEAVRRLAELGQPFSMAAAREILGTSRRVSVPLLEHLDRAGRTKRVDSQLRRVRSR